MKDFFSKNKEDTSHRNDTNQRRGPLLGFTYWTRQAQSLCGSQQLLYSSLQTSNATLQTLTTLAQRGHRKAVLARIAHLDSIGSVTVALPIRKSYHGAQIISPSAKVGGRFLTSCLQCSGTNRHDSREFHVVVLGAGELINYQRLTPLLVLAKVNAGYHAKLCRDF